MAKKKFHCEHPECTEKENTEPCKYCKKWFCSFHLMPKEPIDFEYDRNPEHARTDLFEKVDTKKGHFCREYLEYSLWFEKRKRLWNIFGDFFSDGKALQRGKMAESAIAKKNRERFNAICFSLAVIMVLAVAVFWNELGFELPFQQDFGNSETKLSEQEFNYLNNSIPWVNFIQKENLTVVTRSYGLYYPAKSSHAKEYMRVDIALKYTGETQGYVILTSPGILDTASGSINFTGWSSVNGIRLEPEESVQVSMIYGSENFVRGINYSATLLRIGRESWPEAYSIDIKPGQ